MIICINIWAVKANPCPVDVRQADGTTLTVVLHGDEDFHYYTTTDGILLVQQRGGYYVASTGIDGSLRATTLLAHNAAQRSVAEQTAARAQDITLFMQKGLHSFYLLRKSQVYADHGKSLLSRKAICFPISAALA